MNYGWLTLPKWWQRVTSRFSSTIGVDKARELTPLTPHYSEKDHFVYANFIDQALQNPKIRNIALSGNYGVGKSSILLKVAEQHKKRVVGVSLSALAPVATVDESVEEHAISPTNRIQQEIVKQLLYREEPSKAPGSRFQRIERFKMWRELSIAALVSVGITLVFLLTGWTERIASELVPQLNLNFWKHIITLFFMVGVVIVVRYLLYGRFQIRQLSAGTATITLDKGNVSYFDQYLDEIVYFFEISKCKIVIFEDIDRFDNPHIFETLRALNTLLNSSKKRENNPIRFIYAIKDSIFDHNLLTDKLAHTEIARANRTKFFDLVIPVVPFITHRSARDHATDILKEIDHEINEELIDLACRYVPDMRLLKNVRNEFIVFRDRIFAGDGEELNLSETELFAMMLYKSTHLSDFEAIRFGESKIDQIYRKSRRMVADNIKNIEKDIRNIRLNLNSLDSISNKSSELGDKLIEHINRTIHAVRFQEQNGQFNFGGNQIDKSYLRSSDFWVSFVEAPKNPELLWSRGNQSLRFSRSKIAEALNVNLSTEYWDNEYRKELEENLENKNESLNFLRTADMGELIQREEFSDLDETTETTLSAFLRELLADDLAIQLIQAGYINRNFTLYTSTFHGNRVSAAAQNFIIHHVERETMDEYFKLNEQDVEAILRECGETALSEPALYNIAIMDYLLRTSVSKADVMVKSLRRLGSDERRFLQAYITNATELLQFTKRFVRATPEALVYLVSQVEVEEPIRNKLVNNGLKNLSGNIKYRTDSDIREYLSSNYTTLPVLTETLLSDRETKEIVRFFLKSGAEVSTLKPLSEPIQLEFIEHSIYEVNLENLQVILGNNENMALDNIYSVSNNAYTYMVENLDAYLSAVNGASPTVSLREFFIKVIEDVLFENADKLNDVIFSASDDCLVTELTGVSEGAWPALAFNNRFSPTFNNIRSYIHSNYGFDANLSKLLASTKRIVEVKDIDEDDKAQIAITILKGSKNLPSAYIRTKLVASLNIEYFLDVEDIFAEKGELFGLLVENQIINDDIETYTHILGTDWATRERVIQVSQNFKDYVTPTLLRADLSEFLLSEKIDNTVKIEIVKRADDYFERSNQKELEVLSRFAVKNKCQLSLEIVEQLAANGISAQEVTIFLSPHLEDLPPERLSRILTLLGKEYARLAKQGTSKPKIPNTPENKALLDFLKLHGIASTVKIEGNMLRVYKKIK